MGQLRERGVSSNGKIGEWYVNIRGSKVVALYYTTKCDTVEDSLTECASEGNLGG
jgi:hypothetical protein